MVNIGGKGANVVAGQAQSADVSTVLDQLDIAAARVWAIRQNHGPEGNANWHVWSQQTGQCVLRRYYTGATPEDLAYEHAVLKHLRREGWSVPDALAAPIAYDGRWYCLTRYVPGRSRSTETPSQQRQRGADLARLHIALRSITDRLGQRSGWQAMLDDVPVMTPIDWHSGLAGLGSQCAELAEWAALAATSVANESAALGAADLPLTVIHGDFLAGENVHYEEARLAGVIDFGVSHLGTRPYDLVSARCYREPEVRAGYVEELNRQGWPLSDLEEAAILPIYRAFRLYMTAWQLDVGTRTGHFDAKLITAQLTQTGIDPSGKVHTPKGQFGPPQT